MKNFSIIDPKGTFIHNKYSLFVLPRGLSGSDSEQAKSDATKKLIKNGLNRFFVIVGFLSLNEWIYPASVAGRVLDRIY